MAKTNANAASENTDSMLLIFEQIRLQVGALKASLGPLLAMPEDSEPYRKAAEIVDALFCFDVAMTFYSEANRAIQAQAWFAGAAVSASALEAILLANCFGHQDRIKALPRWKTLPSKLKKDFRIFARSMDLGKLLDIARELKWFPSGGLPEEFLAAMTAYSDASTMTQIRDFFSVSNDVSQICSNQVREYRNLLHPAVCLRENQQPSELAGQAATLVFLVAFTSLCKNVKFL